MKEGGEGDHTSWNPQVKVWRGAERVHGGGMERLSLPHSTLSHTLWTVRVFQPVDRLVCILCSLDLQESNH